LWRSVNGGSTFTFINTGITPQDVDFSPGGAQKAMTAGYGVAMYSWDGGATWQRASGLPVSSGRVEVAYARTQPDTVYALVDYNGGTLYRSSNGGANFSRVSSTPLLDNGQGWYDAALWVNPTDSNHVIVGGVYLRASVDGGATWTLINDGIHVDHHAIVEDPRYDDVTYRSVFFGNDGGVYKASNIRTVAQTGYRALNNSLGVTQFYGGAGSATTGVIVGGTQDNGTVVRQPQSGASWSAGDGRRRRLRRRRPDRFELLLLRDDLPAALSQPDRRRDVERDRRRNHRCGAGVEFRRAVRPRSQQRQSDVRRRRAAVGDRQRQERAAVVEIDLRIGDVELRQRDRRGAVGIGHRLARPGLRQRLQVDERNGGGPGVQGGAGADARQLRHPDHDQRV
jgi:hypothetical protein